jgi:hypothetical protein
MILDGLKWRMTSIKAKSNAFWLFILEPIITKFR